MLIKFYVGKGEGVLFERTRQEPLVPRVGEEVWYEGKGYQVKQICYFYDDALSTVPSVRVFMREGKQR